MKVNEFINKLLKKEETSDIKINYINVEKMDIIKLNDEKLLLVNSVGDVINGFYLNDDLKQTKFFNKEFIKILRSNKYKLEKDCFVETFKTVDVDYESVKEKLDTIDERDYYITKKYHFLGRKLNYGIKRKNNSCVEIGDIITDYYDDKYLVYNVFNETAKCVRIKEIHKNKHNSEDIISFKNSLYKIDYSKSCTIDLGERNTITNRIPSNKVYNIQKTISNKSIINNTLPGDILYVKVDDETIKYYNLNERNSRRPFVVLSNTGKDLKGYYLTCNPNIYSSYNKALNFKISKDKYNLKKDSYVKHRNYAYISYKNVEEYLDTLDKNDLEKIIKCSYLAKNKCFENTCDSGSIEVGDIIYQNCSYYLIYNIKNYKVSAVKISKIYDNDELNNYDIDTVSSKYSVDFDNTIEFNSGKKVFVYDKTTIEDTKYFQRRIDNKVKIYTKKV